MKRWYAIWCVSLLLLFGMGISADTQRTLTDMDAQLPDNVAGAISPEDIRDVQDTVRPHYIGVTLLDADEPQVIDILLQNTWTNMYMPDLVEVASTSFLSLDVVETEIEYTGDVPIILHTTISITMSTLSANDQDIQLAGVLNGTVLDTATYSYTINKNDVPRSFALVYMAYLEPGDMLGINVRNLTSTDDVDVDEFTANHFTMPYEAP